MEKTWKELILKADTFTSKEESSELVKSHLETLNLPALTHLYLQDLSLAKLRNIKKRAESYLIDLHSIKFPYNLIPLSDGLTAYPKIIDLNRAEKISGFMKHLGSEEEMEHHRIYSFFLDLFQTEETETSLYTLSTAAASMLSQSPLTYTHPFPLNHKEEIVPHEQTGYAKYLISYMANANTFVPSERGNTPRILSFEEEQTFQQLIQESPLVFFEHTQGQNIDKWFHSFYKPLTRLNAEIDSLKTEISDLKSSATLKETEEKFIQAESILEKTRPLEINLNNLERQKKAQQDLFIHLGSIAFLDLILGNFDRLIRFDPQNPDWDDVMTCNLGNLMVSENKRVLYAIDNGIGNGKHAPKTEEEDSEEKRIYLEFLERELSSENFETKIATKLVSLLKESLQEEGKAKDLVKNLSDEEREVNEDLKPITSYLRDGILSMKKKLLEKGIDAWHTASFKETLHSGLKETVESRLSILQESLNVTKAGT